MRILAAILGLFPILAAAHGTFDGLPVVGTYQLTSGSGDNSGGGDGITGKNISAGMYAAPEIFAYPEADLFYGGTPSLNFCFGCGLPGPDDGVGVLTVSILHNPALSGMTQVFLLEGYEESGNVDVFGNMDVTGPGIYTDQFSMSAYVAFGLPNSGVADEYVKVVGHGTVTIDVGPAPPGCPFGTDVPPCIGLQVESATYAFAPELDPSALGSALVLLTGALLVLRGRRAGLTVH